MILFFSLDHSNQVSNNGGCLYPVHILIPYHNHGCIVCGIDGVTQGNTGTV